MLRLMTMDGTISAEDVARAQASRLRGLSFPPIVEARFEADTSARRLQALRIVILRTLVIYNLFLFGDYLLAPDGFGLSLLLHVLVVTPWMLIALALISKPVGPVIRNLLMASLPLAMLGGILAVFVVSRDPNVTHYQYFAVIAVMFGNVVLRPTFSYAVAMSALAVLGHAAACLWHPLMPTPVGLVAVFGLVVSTGMTLLAGYSIERDMRRAYLTRLKDQLARRHLQQTAADLEQMSHVDPLTGLANRRGVDARVAALFANGQAGRAFAVLMIDVDHFKGFNDQYGHLEGDRCLTLVAAAVGSAVREGTDIVGRFGGEEFIAILPDASHAAGARIAGRMRRALEGMALPHAGSPFGIVTMSIGIGAGSTGEAASLGAAIDKADAALYVAKAAGRNRVQGPRSRSPEVWPSRPGNGDVGRAA